uniref:Nucleolar protein 11 n=1 Tax=Rhinopithecus bieti TaxID=61621 RepID=A0A2K6MB68_RHIBE
MAALEEEFTLSSIVLSAGPEGLLGVEQSDETDQFLVTDSGRTVILYKVSDHKPLGSWSVKQGQIITCPAVCNFQTREYIVVHDNKVLRIWNNEDVNLDKVFKATLSAEVYRILSVQGTEPLVLFKEGAVRGLEALLADPQQKIETVISDEEVINKFIKIKILVRSLLLKAVVSGNTQNGVALTALDQDHVAVLGSPLAASKECLSVWNIKFQTLQTSKELPQGTSGQPVYGENLFMLHGKISTVKCPSLAGLWKLKNCAFCIFLGTHVMPRFVNWETPQGCGLGFQNSEQSRRILRRRKIEVSLQPEVPPSKQLLSTIMEDSEKHIEVEVRKFLALKQTPDFHTVIGDTVTGLLERCKAEPSFYPRNCLMQLIQTHVLSYSLCPDLMEIALIKKDVQLLQLCLQQFPDIPESVTCACLKTFLSIGDDSLQETDVSMESVFDYSNSVHDEKMEEQTEILQNGFNPEEDKCSNCDQELNKKSQDETKESTSCPVVPKRAALLNAILHSAYSETFLLPHLKDIPAQHITLFLKYLYFLYLKCSENATMTLPGIHPPTLNQIMDWICLLLDANFTVVVMMPEAKRLLINLYKLVKSQVFSGRAIRQLNQEKNNRGLYVQ